MVLTNMRLYAAYRGLARKTPAFIGVPQTSRLNCGMNHVNPPTDPFTGATKLGDSSADGPKVLVG